MSKPRTQSINFNSIRTDLDDEEIRQLKFLFQFYHKRAWCYTQLAKQIRRKKWILNSVAAITACSTIASVIATHSASLIAIGAASIILKGYMKTSNMGSKLATSICARDLYRVVCDNIKGYLRGLPYNKIDLVKELSIIDSQVDSLAPVVPLFIKNRYDEIYDTSI